MILGVAYWPQSLDDAVSRGNGQSGRRLLTEKACMHSPPCIRPSPYRVDKRPNSHSVCLLLVQCVTAVEPEWLAELGPMFFSIKVQWYNKLGRGLHLSSSLSVMQSSVNPFRFEQFS